MKPFLFPVIFVLACHADQPGRTIANAGSPAPNARAAACPTQENGDRPGYHSGAGPWIRDCNTPWKREYFRVFTQKQGEKTTAYLLPRPDGTPAIESVCARGDDLRPTLERYGWCDEAVEPDRVNNMAVDDALAIAHTLHEKMKFVGGEGGVWPYPMPDDVVLACKQDPAIGDACAAYSPRDNDLAIIPSAKSASAMAAALNKLYGIP
jgi:hypothetical protein